METFDAFLKNASQVSAMWSLAAYAAALALVLNKQVDRTILIAGIAAGRGRWMTAVGLSLLLMCLVPAATHIAERRAK